LPPAEKAQADIQAAALAYSAAMADRAGMVAPVAPREPAEIADLRRQIDEQKQIIQKATTERDAAQRRGAALALNASDHGGACPTCCRPMDDSARDALRAGIAALSREQDAADAIASEATDIRDCLMADLLEANAEADRVFKAFTQANADHAGSVARMDADIATKKRAHLEAEALLVRCQGAEGERQKLKAESAKIATGDAEMLRAQIAGATQERTDLMARRDAVLAAESTRAAYQGHVADRDAQTEALPLLKAAAEAWRDLVNQVAESALQPFIEACNAALPTGWSMDFDLDTGDFRVGRGDLWVLFSALSGG